MTVPGTPGSVESVQPPRWAEAALRTVLSPDAAETVSGDLLEEYRDSVRRTRGRAAADFWYARQVAGFIRRSAWLWAVLFAALFVGRTALDWFVPPADFLMRSRITTWAAMAVFVTAGFWTAWRSRSIRGSALAGFSAAVMAAVLCAGGALVLLAINGQDYAAIDNSGGLDEVFVLPVFVIVPATALATLGGLAGKLLRAGQAGSR